MNVSHGPGTIIDPLIDVTAYPRGRPVIGHFCTHSAARGVGTQVRNVLKTTLSGGYAAHLGSKLSFSTPAVTLGTEFQLLLPQFPHV